MENDSARVSLQETTEAEPGIEPETNMGRSADDGDYDAGGYEEYYDGGDSFLIKSQTTRNE